MTRHARRRQRRTGGRGPLVGLVVAGIALPALVLGLLPTSAATADPIAATAGTAIRTASGAAAASSVASAAASVSRAMTGPDGERVAAAATVVRQALPAPGSASLTLSDARAGADLVRVAVTVSPRTAGFLAGIRVALPSGSGVPAQNPTVVIGSRSVAATGTVRSPGVLNLALSAPVAVVAGTPVSVRLTGAANPGKSGRKAGRVDLLRVDGSALTTATPGVTYAAAPACGSFRGAGWIASENTRAGSAWRIGRGGSDIEGFADRPSTQCGETVTLKVSTSAPSYTVQVYRMGWYGGAGARLVWSSGTLKGRKQAAPVVRASTGTVIASWQPSTTLRVTGAWPPGQYLVKLRSSTGKARFVPLTVRDDGSNAALVVQSSVMTWQAYNSWGGYSLYRGPGDNPATRGVIASFDRPYGADGVNRFGDGEFVSFEQPFVAWAEREGLDVTYWTDVDLDARPALLQRHRGLVLLTHDEYWTPAMRSGAQAARDRGVNIAVLGADAMYWRSALTGSPESPRRTLTVYRTPDRDPFWTLAPAKATNRWRDGPLALPESLLLGQMYDCIATNADGQVTAPDSWVFDGTGLGDLATLSSIVWRENDRYWPGHAPAGLQLLAHSRFACTGHADLESGWDLTYYTAPSRAGVFAAGTMGWVCNLDASCETHRGDTAMQQAISRITGNVLRVFAAGPAGVRHPSVGNTGEVCARLGCVGNGTTPVDTGLTTIESVTSTGPFAPGPAGDAD